MSLGSKSPTAMEAFELSRLCRAHSELAPHPLVAINGQKQLVFYGNAAFAQLIGRDVSDLAGRTFAEILPSEAAKDCRAVLERVIQTGAPETLTEQEHDYGKGSSHYWTYSLWPILGRRRRQLGVMMQVTDATEAVTFHKQLIAMNTALMTSLVRQHELADEAAKLNVQLQIATDEKNLFLAMMSHEIRTPLNAVQGYAELLCLPNQSDEARRNYEDRIKRNTHHLLRLIEDILDLAKIEAGRLEVEILENNFRELLSEIELVMGSAARAKGLTFSWRLVGGTLPETILLDPTRFTQILTNIISNAIKFTEVGTVSVAVHAQPVSDKLRILVKDTGRRPIIALTAHAIPGETERCRNAGCNAFLSKPVNTQELVTMMQRVLHDSYDEMAQSS